MTLVDNSGLLGSPVGYDDKREVHESIDQMHQQVSSYEYACYVIDSYNLLVRNILIFQDHPFGRRNALNEVGALLVKREDSADHKQMKYELEGGGPDQILRL